MLDNSIIKYEDNELKDKSPATLDLNSQEAENKLRFDMNKSYSSWKLSYGGMAQLARYTNSTYSLIRKQVIGSEGQIVQPELSVNFVSPIDPFYKFGAFIQASKRFFDNLLGVSGGIRTDVNTFTTTGMNPIKTLSPRVSLSYFLNQKWSANASIGRYTKIPPYTILGFADRNLNLVNKDAEYQISNHFVSGLEYLPNESLRFTLEGFYKLYENMPVSKINGIALANLGTDFNVLGNEEVIFNGRGKAYGLEFFAQKKLSDRFFGIFSYTYYRSLFSGLDNKLVPSSWDNRHLLSFAWGYKFKRNWELGLKFRYQGGAPYSPIDEEASRINFATQGTTIYDFTQLNTLRLGAFNSSDVRIDKKINLKRTTLDLYLEVNNWYVFKSPDLPEFTLKRNPETKGFETKDGLPLRPDASNGIPLILRETTALVTPTIGFILEF